MATEGKIGEKGTKRLYVTIAMTACSSDYRIITEDRTLKRIAGAVTFIAAWLISVSCATQETSNGYRAYNEVEYVQTENLLEESSTPEAQTEEAEAYSIQITPSQDKRQCGNCW